MPYEILCRCLMFRVIAYESNNPLIIKLYHIPMASLLKAFRNRSWYIWFFNVFSARVAAVKYRHTNHCVVIFFCPLRSSSVCCLHLKKLLSCPRKLCRQLFQLFLKCQWYSSVNNVKVYVLRRICIAFK